MEFSRQSSSPRPISLIPMINVVFLLLSFFLIAGQIGGSRTGGVELPLSSQPRDPLGEGVVLTLLANGQILVDDEAVKPERVAVRVVEKQGRADVPLLVQADKQADGAVLVRLLAALEAEGVAHVALLTEGF